MTTVSREIYLARPGLVGFDEDSDYIDLDEALSESAAKATEITILGGYYNPAALGNLCQHLKKSKRKNCKVRIAVGLDAPKVVNKVWHDLQKLRKRLLKLGFKDVVVAFVPPKPTHFHTKLFGFVHTTKPVWFVGSANPGSKRHELLVKLSGRHEALLEYVDAVFSVAVDVQEAPPEEEISTLRDFFLSGVLCHKPHVVRLFTFDAFHFDPEHREMLAKALGHSSAVSHANPTTQGFGFDLRSALSLGTDFQDVTTGTTRLQFRPYSIDTVLGWWMPRIYAPRLRSQVIEEERARENRLIKIGAALNSPDGDATVRKEFAAHIESMQAYLDEHSIGARPVNNRDARFDKFLASRKKSLGDGPTIARLSRTLMLTEMPDVWAGDTAVADFEESFFDDLAFRAGAQKKSAVVRSIIEWLEDDTLSTGDEIAEAFKAMLKEYAWKDEDWY